MFDVAILVLMIFLSNVSFIIFVFVITNVKVIVVRMTN